METRPPRGVNLMAFKSRFQTTCRSLLASPLIMQASYQRPCYLDVFGFGGRVHGVFGGFDDRGKVDG